MRLAAFGVGVVLLGLSTGCGLRLRLVDAAVHKPSNVALYFSLHDARGNPLPNLAAPEFRILEDDQLVSAFESKQTILNPSVAAVHYTLLLVDMSGSVVGSGGLAELTEAAGAFTEQVGRVQKVAVYAFDGSRDIYPVTGFSTGGGRAGVAALQSFRPRDPSTNLNGAVIEAMRVLDAEMQRAAQPLRFGTLVVFTDGTDHAHRVSRDDLVKALDEHQDRLDLFVIGVGAEIDEGELSTIGRSGAVLSRDPGAVKAAFARLAARVEGYTRSFYLLSYCSPSRAGQHTVRVVAQPPGKGKGSLEFRFDATGFGPDCDPNAPPGFDMAHPRGLRPTRAATGKRQ